MLYRRLKRDNLQRTKKAKSSLTDQKLLLLERPECVQRKKNHDDPTVTAAIKLQ